MTTDPHFEEISLFSVLNEERPINCQNKEKSTTKSDSITSNSPETSLKKTDTDTRKMEIIKTQESRNDTGSSLTASDLWADKYWEFDITHPMQTIRDTIKTAMVNEGFTKREVNHIFKGLFFKEKIFNTKTQAIEYLKTIPSTYAVKYKIGIAPSPQMVSLQKRLNNKEETLRLYQETQNKKFHEAFILCPVCRSKINTHYVTPPLCPVCHNDLRSATTIKKLNTLEKNIADLTSKYEQTARKYNSQFTGGEKWIIHTINTYKK